MTGTDLREPAGVFIGARTWNWKKTSSFSTSGSVVRRWLGHGSAMPTSRAKSPLWRTTEAREMHASIGIGCPSGLVKVRKAGQIVCPEWMCVCVWNTEASLVVIDSWSGQWGRPARSEAPRSCKPPPPRVGRPQSPNATKRLFSADSPGARHCGVPEDPMRSVPR